MEVHSGVLPGLEGTELLDLRNRVAACVRLDEVQGRAQELLDRAAATGVTLCDGDAQPGEGPRLVGSSSGAAEVLTLPAGAAGSEGEPERPASAEELQRSIDSLRGELDCFGAQLEQLGEAISRRATPRGRPVFAPPPRNGAAGEEPAESAADRAAALEVAKRSTWYRQPPPLLPTDVPLIEVHQSITQTTIHRCPSRPRTAHPRLFVTAPPPAPAPAAPEEEEEGPLQLPEPDAGLSAVGAAAEEPAAGQCSSEAPDEEAKGPRPPAGAPGEEVVTAEAAAAAEDAELDPFCNSGVSWHIA